jgi:Cft2 family RNA processing exonuclease
MATPSGLQSGVSRDAFEAWCEDKRNTVIIVDFAVQVRGPGYVCCCAAVLGH